MKKTIDFIKIKLYFFVLDSHANKKKIFVFSVAWNVIFFSFVKMSLKKACHATKLSFFIYIV